MITYLKYITSYRNMMISRNEINTIVNGGGQIPDISIPFDLSEINTIKCKI